jgi:hypothetical protein
MGGGAFIHPTIVKLIEETSWRGPENGQAMAVSNPHK